MRSAFTPSASRRRCSTTLGLPILSGRTFTEQEAENPAAAVALLNQSLANRLWPGDSAIDRRIGFRGSQDITWLRVVGVVPDIHYEEIGEGTEASRLNVYVPYSRDGSRSMALLVRADGAPEALIAPTRDLLAIAQQQFPGVSADANDRAAPLHDLGAGVFRQPDGRVRRRCVAAGVPRHLRADFVLGRPSLARDRRATGAWAPARRMSWACCCAKVHGSAVPASPPV